MPASQPAAEQAPDDPYNIQEGLWQDKPNFGCPHCPYEDLARANVEEHIDTRHRPRRAPVTLFNAEGNLIR
jgi:hypothetical protein